VGLAPRKDLRTMGFLDLNSKKSGVDSEVVEVGIIGKRVLQERSFCFYGSVSLEVL